MRKPKGGDLAGVPAQLQCTRVPNLAHSITGTHLAVFSFPEVRWQLTNPKDVPLNMKEMPTAPLLPGKQK